MKKSLLTLLFVVLIGSLLISGCSSGAKSTPTTAAVLTSTETTEVKSEKEATSSVIPSTESKTVETGSGAKKLKVALILSGPANDQGWNATALEGLQAAEKLSALYWELVYQNLAQGDMRNYAISESLRFCERVLAQQPQHPQHNLRRGLLLHALGRMDEAEQAYARAQQLGLPATRVLPYLAELSFEQRDFAKTRQLMQQLDEWSALPRLRPVIDYWSAR